MTQHFKYELTTESSGVFLQCDPSELVPPRLLYSMWLKFGVYIPSQ